MNKRISVIIVSFNSEDFIKRCIESVLKNISKEDEIIVLDNASTDKTCEVLDGFKDKINFIKSDKNLGFGKGNNLAAKEAHGEYLFLLNPDTYIEKPVLNELLEYYKDNDCGILAPKLVMSDGKVQESVKKLPTVLGAFKEFVLGIKNSYSQYVPATNTPVEVEAVYGAAMLIKRELFEKLKGFDENFFLYYEDVDLCKRVRRMGKKIVYYPSVQITHLVGATKSDEDKYLLNQDSAKIYHGFLGYLMLQIVFLIPRLRRHL